MKNLFTLIFLIFMLHTVEAKKRALIIAVGDYPSKSGWGVISSVNDVSLIKQSLLAQKFLEEDIVVLINEKATKKGIVTALEVLRSKTEAGDIIVIHYSGHGQQIFDDNEDEADAKDESLVPYDAFARYNNNYKGDNHLRDDELGNIIAAFRNRLGKNGQLLFLLDSCHSGSATRGGKSRGGMGTFAPDGWTENSMAKGEKGSAMLETVRLQSDAAPFVIISGASADELNYEYENYGSLSYSFSKAMNELGSDFTYRQLFSAIASNMNVISPKQTPTIEGDVDYKLFKGEYTKQQPYFEIKKMTKSDIFTLKAGKIQGVFQATTILVLPAGTTTVTTEKVLAKGTITNAGFNESIVKLEKALPDLNDKKYWIFIDTPSYGDMYLNIYFDKTVTDSNFKTGIKLFLEQNKLGEIVQDTIKSDVIINKLGNSYSLNVSKGNSTFDLLANSRGQEDIKEVSEKLFHFAQGQYLKNLSMKNYDYEFDFKLVPVDFDESTRTVLAIKALPLKNETSEILKVFKGDHVAFQITNKSNKPLYFSVIEINSKGEISSFMPNNKCPMNDNERKIEPGKTVTYDKCIFSFSPPYEVLMLKAFASSSPINFQPTVTTRGEGTKGNANPLEKFIQQSYTQSRGSDANEVSEKVDGFSTEFLYEIVEK